MSKIDNRVLILLFVLTLIIISAGIFSPLFSRPHQTRELDEPSPQSFITLTGEKVPFGISPLMDKDTYQAYMLTGLSDKFYKKNDNYYMEILVPVKNKTVNFLVDLGTDKYIIVNISNQAELLTPTIVAPDTNLRRIKQSFYNISIKELGPSLETLVGKPAQIEILVSASLNGQTCNDICAMRLAELKTYQQNNRSLGSDLSQLKGNTVSIGAPISIQFGN